MRARKLTMLKIYTGCGESTDVVFLWCDYLDGKLDRENAEDEVDRVRPNWRPYLESCA